MRRRLFELIQPLTSQCYARGEKSKQHEPLMLSASQGKMYDDELMYVKKKCKESVGMCSFHIT